MLITIPDLRKFIQPTPEQDEDLTVERDSVVALWEKETRRLWERRAGHVYQTVPMAERQTRLYLNLWPVETITQVEVIKKTVGTVGVFEVLAASSYRLEGDHVLRAVGTEWSDYEEIKVTYDGGYTRNATGSQVETPKDIIKALGVQVLFERSRMGSQNIDIQSQNFRGGSGVFIRADLHPYFKKRAEQRMHKRPG